ncbi:MAG: hypothetical protein JXQ75_01895 [Phycisphaerae bacterium]|nr:hypothetical protein [Phycisphaerae bacterium]
MITRCRRCAALIAIFAILVVSTVAAWPLGPATADPPASSSAADSSATRDDPGGPAYTIQFKFQPDAVSYYIIENEVRDGGTITGLLSLSYATTAKDRRSIIQRVLVPTTRPASAQASSQPSAARDGSVRLSWECDRYEVHEERRSIGPKSVFTFDSLRDSYPTPSLRELGKIPGSRSDFSIDPHTGQVSDVQITHGEVAGPATGKALSKTSEKCSPSPKNLQNMLRLLGPYYLPKTPVRVGDHWTTTHTEVMEPLGTVVTDLDCTLESVHEIEGSLIARINLTGQMGLQSSLGGNRDGSSPSAASGPASQPGGRRARGRSGRYNFEIGKSVCTGFVEFDLTRGEPVQMTLRRELDGEPKLKAAKAGKESVTASIQAEVAHVYRVQVSHTPPPKPIIVGGPKPPIIPPEDLVKPRPPAKRKRTTTKPSRPSTKPRQKVTTQRAGPRRAEPKTGRSPKAPQPTSRPADVKERGPSRISPRQTTKPDRESARQRIRRTRVKPKTATPKRRAGSPRSTTQRSPRPRARGLTHRTTKTTTQRAIEKPATATRPSSEG